jgi:hypothetical protein
MHNPPHTGLYPLAGAAYQASVDFIHNVSGFLGFGTFPGRNALEGPSAT